MLPRLSVGGGDHHRRHEHQGKGIGDAAGQIEQRRQLQHVEGEIERGFAIGEAVRWADSATPAPHSAAALTAMATAQ